MTPSIMIVERGRGQRLFMPPAQLARTIEPTHMHRERSENASKLGRERIGIALDRRFQLPMAASKSGLLMRQRRV